MTPKKVVALSVLLYFSIFFSNVAIAHGESAYNVGVEVNHISGGFEKIQEKVTLFLKFNKQDQTKYREYLAKKRLAELKYILDNNQIDSIEEIASRYETYIGSLTNFVIDNKVTSEKESLLKMYSEHESILEEYAGKFEQGSGWWFVIEHDININRISAQRVTDLK